MKTQFKLIFVLVTGLIMSSGNAFAITTVEELARLEAAMTAEISQLMEEGKTLKEAAAITTKKNAVAIKNNPEISKAIYSAILAVATVKGIGTFSREFNAVLAGTSDILINELGVSETAVLSAGIGAGLDSSYLVASLPAAPAGQASSALQNLGKSYRRMLGLSLTPSSAGGNAGSPST
jgi:hypothetical protein